MLVLQFRRNAKIPPQVLYVDIWDPLNIKRNNNTYVSENMQIKYLLLRPVRCVMLN